MTGEPNLIDALRKMYGTDKRGFVRAVAARLFEAHNRSKGVLYPGGFDFLSPNDQAPWLRRAQGVISSRAAA